MTKSCEGYFEFFHHIFRYDQKTGKLYWRKRLSNRIRVGDEVGAIDRKSDSQHYLRTSIDGRKWYVHRVIFIMLYGDISDDILIDHRDGDGLNNKPDNLRLADGSLNSANARRSPKRSGCVGVTWWRTKGYWKARITVNKEVINLGYFRELKDAIAARKAAEKKHGWSR